MSMRTPARLGQDIDPSEAGREEKRRSEAEPVNALGLPADGHVERCRRFRIQPRAGEDGAQPLVQPKSGQVE